MIFPLLLVIDLLEAIPQWVELALAVGAAIGATYRFVSERSKKKISQLEQKEQRRFSRIEEAQDSLKEAQSQILNGFERVIAQLNNLREEDALKIDGLEAEVKTLTELLRTSQEQLRSQESVLQGVKFVNRLMVEAEDAPTDAKEWIKKSSLGQFLRGEKSLKDITLERVETIPSHNLSNLPRNDGS